VDSHDIGIFFFFLWIGDFGNLVYLTQSPITTYVQTLWSVTYIAAGGVSQFSWGV